MRSIPLLALLDQPPPIQTTRGGRRVVESLVDTLSSTARLICSKQATFIHRLHSKCSKGDL